MSKKPKLGSGVRFKKLANKFAHEGIENPGALAYKMGVKAHGKATMTRLAKQGKARHAKEHESKESRY